MTVTMATADQALKILYLGVLQQQLNVETDPLFNAIGNSTENITGKQVTVMAPFGLNGGVGAGSETGNLPAAGGNFYQDFISSTKNLYGVINISDKSIQASANNAGAFVNLLNAELDGLMVGSKFNLSRMLWGDGSGLLCTCGTTTTSTTVNVADTTFLTEGMTVDIVATATGTPISNGTARRIIALDRAGKKAVLDSVGGNVTTDNTMSLVMQGSFNAEITGLKKIFAGGGSLYGVDRTTNYWMNPYLVPTVGSISDVAIQKGIDYLADYYNGDIDFIACSNGVKRAYLSYLEQTKRNVNTMTLNGGFTALNYNNIPLTGSRFAPSGTMKLLDTDEFTFYHMGDWRWLDDEGGHVLKQVPGTPTYTATLVRYGELMCKHPGSMAELSGITEA